MQSRFPLNVVVGKSAAIIELLALEDKALLVRRNAICTTSLSWIFSLTVSMPKGSTSRVIVFLTRVLTNISAADDSETKTESDPITTSDSETHSDSETPSDSETVLNTETESDAVRARRVSPREGGLNKAKNINEPLHYIRTVDLVAD